MRFPKLVTTTVLSLATLGSSRPLEAQEFSPAACFPASTILYVEVDVGGLRAAIPETPFGKIYAYPQFQKALGRLPRMIRQQITQQTGELNELLGGDIFRFIEVIGGKWTIAIEDNFPHDTANAYVALDLRDKKADLAKLVEMYLGFLGESVGAQPVKRAVSDHQVTSVAVPIPDHAIHTVVLGAHLVLGFGMAERFDAVVQRFTAGKTAAEGSGLGSDPVYARTQGKGLESSLVRAVLHVENIRKLAERVFGQPGAEEQLTMVKQVLGVIGFDKVASIELELALTEGDLEGSFAIDSPGGLGGLVKLLADSFGGGDTAALGKVPANVSALVSCSIDEGRFFREIEKLAQGLPEAIGAAPLLAQFAQAFEQTAGLSMKDDLQTLPKLDVTVFRAMPPAGGLLPDSYALCKTTQIVPYLQALDKFARKVGANITGLEIQGHDVAYLRVKSLLRSFGIGPSSGPLATLPDEAKMAILALDPGVSIAFTPLDAEWVLVADSPQAIERYFLSHAKAETVADAERWKPLLEKTKGDRTAFLLLGGGESVLVGYNSLLAVVSMLGPTVEPALKELGVDLAQLPPGEEFLPYFQPGYVYARVSDGAVEIRGHRVLTNTLPMILPEAVTFLAKLFPFVP